MPDSRLPALEAVAREAGKLALEFYFGEVEVEHKSDHSVVTEADRAVERLLSDRLLEIEPDARILGEEGTTAATAPDGKATWAIDPIDGTAMFVAALPTWAISIGLVRDGRAELGCVYLPVADEMFLAGSDGPLLWNDREVRYGSNPRPDRVDGDRQPFICLPSNHFRRYRVNYPAKVRSFGSTAIHFAWAARGAAIGASSFAHLWDVAGGLACCRASGLSTGYLSGAKLDLDAMLSGERTTEPIVVAHPDDYEQVRQSIEIIER